MPSRWRGRGDRVGSRSCSGTKHRAWGRITSMPATAASRFRCSSGPTRSTSPSRRGSSCITLRKRFESDLEPVTRGPMGLRRNGRGGWLSGHVHVRGGSVVILILRVCPLWTRGSALGVVGVLLPVVHGVGGVGAFDLMLELVPL